MKSSSHANLIFMYSHISECLREELGDLWRVVQMRSVYLEFQCSFAFVFFSSEGSAEKLNQTKTKSTHSKLNNLSKMKGSGKVKEKYVLILRK